jgi:hypothetical protein
MKPGTALLILRPGSVCDTPAVVGEQQYNYLKVGYPSCFFKTGELGLSILFWSHGIKRSASEL